MDQLADARRWVRTAERVVVLTGAGTSTDSGIPDFRGPNGLWTKNPEAEKASNLTDYLSNADLRKQAWQNRLHAPLFAARPNVCHASFVTLERRGQLLAIVTQNVDGLHQAAGNDPARVIEVHGTAHWTICWECGDRRPMQQILDRVRAGDPDPACVVCGGVIKSDTILFGQPLVPHVIDAALTAADRCDLLIAAGSSLSVFPAANVVPRAKSAGAKVVIANGERTGMDRYADALLLGPLRDTLPALCGGPAASA